MKPDRVVCQNCGKEIDRGKWCSDKCRMANKRTAKPEQSTAKVEQNTNPNTNKGEHLNPEQLENEQPEQDTFRASLTKTDKTFYDRAMRDFKNPYYNFDAELHEEKCLFCGEKFKTRLRMGRFCSYEHYKAPWKNIVGA